MLLASWRTRYPCSRSRRPRAVAVARHLLRPLPPLRSPCLHVAVAPLRSRRHCAFAGDHRAYALRAVLCCLVRHVGRPWLRSLVGRVVGVVVAVLGVGRVRTRLVPYSSAFSAALGFTLLSASLLASLLAPVSESLSRGGGGHHPWIVRHQCVVTPVRRVSAAWALSATFPPGGLNNANTPIPRLPGPTWPLLIHREHGDPGPQQPLLRGVPWVVRWRLPWPTLMPFAFALARL